MALAAGCTTAALFPDYYRNSSSLASSASVVWYNLPSILVWAVAAALLLARRSRTAGAGMAIGATICWFPAYLVDIGALVTRAQSVGPGVVLGLVGLAGAIAGSGLAFCLLVRHQVRLSAARFGPLWAIAAGGFALVFAVGHSLPSLALHVHFATPGWSFPTTGTPDVTTRYGSVLQQHGWSLASTVLTCVFAVLVSVLAASCKPIRVGVASLFGTALVLAAFPIVDLVVLQQGPPSAAALHMSDAGAPAITQYGLVGLWMILLGTAGLVLVGIGRGLSGLNHRS